MSIGVGQEVRDVILAMLGHGQERTGPRDPGPSGASWPPSPSASAVVVVDDVQHAAPKCLALLAALAEPLRSLPVLMICLARPELLEGRPTGEAAGPRRGRCRCRRWAKRRAGCLLAWLTPRPPAMRDCGLPDATRSERAATAAREPRCFSEVQLARHVQENPGSHTSFPPARTGCSRPGSTASPGRADGPRARGRRGGSLPPGVGRGLPGPAGRAPSADPGLDRALDALIRRDFRPPVAAAASAVALAVGFRHRLIREAAYATPTRADRARAARAACRLAERSDAAELAGPPGVSPGTGTRTSAGYRRPRAPGGGHRGPGGVVADRRGATGRSPWRTGGRDRIASSAPSDALRTAVGCRSGTAAHLGLCARRSEQRSTTARRDVAASSVSARGTGLGCPWCAGDPPWSSSARALYHRARRRGCRSRAWTWSGRRARYLPTSATTLASPWAHYLHAELLWMNGEPDSAKETIASSRYVTPSGSPLASRSPPADLHRLVPGRWLHPGAAGTAPATELTAEAAGDRAAGSDCSGFQAYFSRWPGNMRTRAR